MTLPRSKHIALHRLGLVFLLSLSFFTSAPAADDIVLPRQGDTAVVIPSNGMWYAEEDFKRATVIARKRNVIDEYVKGQASESKRKNIVDALEEARLAAAHETASAIEYARSISATSPAVKAKQFDLADSLLKWIDSMMASGPPDVDFPTTKIGVKPDGAYFMHYKSILQYTKEPGPAGWSSYTEGDKIRVGLYVFRVQLQSGGKSFFEQVSVWDEPTQKVINVIFTSP